MLHAGIVALSGLCAFCLSALLTWRFCQPDSMLHILDHPNERSLHAEPTPRSGGIAIVTAITLAGAGLVLLNGPAPSELGWLATAMLVVAATSFVEDRFQLSVALRVVMHFVSAGLIVTGGLVLSVPLLPSVDWTFSGTAAIVVSVFYLVWMINLYNFMDGMDGSAGGMAIFGFSAFAVLGALADQPLFAALNIIIAAAAGGFLLFNFPPARIFMGDTGSSSLGLLAASFSLWGARAEIFPFWAAVLVFSPFIVDATVTIIRRTLVGEKPWLAHKTHYYQRLVQLGLGHRTTVLWGYFLMAVCVVSAIWAIRQPAQIQWAVIASWLCGYVALAALVASMERRQSCKN